MMMALEGYKGESREAQPREFSAIRGDDTNIDSRIARGKFEFAININWKTGTIYFGDNHNGMHGAHPIPRNLFYKGVAEVDGRENVHVTQLWDMTGSMMRTVSDPDIRERIAQTIRRDIFNVTDRS